MPNLRSYKKYKEPCDVCQGFNPLTCNRCDIYVNTIQQWLCLINITIEQKIEIHNSLQDAKKYWGIKDINDNNDGLFTEDDYEDENR